MSITVRTEDQLQAALNGNESPIIIEGTIEINKGLLLSDRLKFITGGANSALKNNTNGPIFTSPANSRQALEIRGVDIDAGNGWVSTTTGDYGLFMFGCQITSSSMAAAFQGTINSSVELRKVTMTTPGPVTSGVPSGLDYPNVQILQNSNVTAAGGIITKLADSKISGSAPFEINMVSNSEINLVASFTYPDEAVIAGSIITATNVGPTDPTDRAAQISSNRITTTDLCNIQAKLPITGNIITALYAIFRAFSAIGNKVMVTAPNTPNNIFNVDQVAELTLRGPGGVGNVPRSTFDKDDVATTMLQLDNLNLDGDMWVMMDAQQNNVVATHNKTETGPVSTFKGQITNVKTVQVSSTTNPVGAVNVSGLVFPPVTQFTP